MRLFRLIRNYYGLRSFHVSKPLKNIVVDTQQGKLRGSTGQNYYGGVFYKFLGIPYAKAPVGDLRFKVNILNMFE